MRWDDGIILRNVPIEDVTPALSVQVLIWLLIILEGLILGYSFNQQIRDQACSQFHDVTTMESHNIFYMKDLFKFLKMNNVTTTTTKGRVFWKSFPGKE